MITGAMVKEKSKKEDRGTVAEKKEHKSLPRKADGSPPSKNGRD